jgi:hypothetical protein
VGEHGGGKGNGAKRLACHQAVGVWRPTVVIPDSLCEASGMTTEGMGYRGTSASWIGVTQASFLIS